MSDWLARAVTQRPALVLLVALLVTLGLAPFAMRLRLDTNVYDLFPTDDPVARAFAHFSQSFVEDPVVLVLVESPDAAALSAFVDPFAVALKRSPLVADVRHRLTGDAARFFRDHLLSLLGDDEIAMLATKLADPEARAAQLRRLRGLLAAPGGSSLAPLLTADPFELLPLVQQRLGAGVAIDASSGLFRSADGKALLVYVRPSHAGSDPETTRALIADIGRAAAPLGARLTEGVFTGAGVELSVTGPSIYALSYRDWLHRDMTRSTVLSALAVLVLFGLFFRALRVLPLVGLPLLVGVGWTGALAELLFHRINAVSLAFGTILIAIGIDLPIQLHNRLREELCAHDLREALQRTIARFTVPAIVATLGPAAVFAACLVSRFRGLRELGALSALGLVVNCIAMLTIFPALLASIPSRLWGARAVPIARAGLFRALARLAVRHPKRVAAIAIAIGCTALPFAARLRFDTHLFAQPPLMAPSLVQAELERRFGQRDGAAIAYAEMPSEELALQQSEAWIAHVDAWKREGLIDTFQSLSLLVPSEATQRRRAQALHGSPELAASVRHDLDALDLDASAFEPFVHQLDGTFAPIHVRDLPHELDFVTRLHLHDGRIATFFYAPHDAPMERLDALKAQIEKVPDTTVTGKPFLERLLRDMAQRDLLGATALAVGLVVLLVSVYYRRWRPVLSILLPLGLAWALFAAGLAWLAIPLNLFNLLAVPLVVGYGIDDHVFLIDRFSEHGDVEEALASTGQAILVTSLATMAGFVPLALARFPALRLLGISGALAVGLCLIAAFALLPALLVLFRKP